MWSLISLIYRFEEKWEETTWLGQLHPECKHQHHQHHPHPRHRPHLPGAHFVGLTAQHCWCECGRTVACRGAVWSNRKLCLQRCRGPQVRVNHFVSLKCSFSRLSFIIICRLVFVYCLSIALCYYQAFTTIAIFNSMRFCLALMPLSVKALAEAAVSVARLRVNSSFCTLLNRLVAVALTNTHAVMTGYYGNCSLVNNRNSIPS